MAGVDAVLDSLFSKVSETTVANEKLPAPLADSYSNQLVSVDVNLEKIKAMFDTLIFLQF